MGEVERVPATMTAAAAVRYGGPEVMEPVTVPVPVPGTGQLLVRVAAASMNPADAFLRSGRLRFVFRTTLPFVTGLDLAGVVASTGPGVHGWSVGEPVWAVLPKSAGAHAGYAVVDASIAARPPATVPLGQAAALPLVALTALQALRDVASVRAGRRVVVVGAAGGVGSAAVQIACALGASVTGTSSARGLDLVRALGADEALDRRGEGSPARLAARPADAALDSVSKLGPWALHRLVRPGGVAVTVNPVLGNAAVRAVTRRLPGGGAVAGIPAHPDAADLTLLAAWVDEGRLRPVVARELPLAEAAQAHRLVGTGTTHGKIVLIVDEELARTRVP